MVAALKVNRVQKISLFIVFSVSGLVAACAIGRLIATTALTAVDKSPVQDFPCSSPQSRPYNPSPYNPSH